MRAWPDGEDLLALMSVSTGPRTRVRDAGTLVAAAYRPRTVLTGCTCYPNALLQAAALLHAIMVWQPLELWNSGLAWAATRAYLERSAFVLEMLPKQRMELTFDITSGSVTEVNEIASRLAPHLKLR
jgi:death-on-curing protein